MELSTVTTATANETGSEKIVSMHMPAARAVSKKETAALLGVSEKTVERLINRGELPGFRVGWKWRVMLRDLEAYIARQQVAERQRIGKNEGNGFVNG